MSDNKEKKSAGCLVEFLFYLIALFVGLISIGLVVMGALSAKGPIAFLGIGLSVVFAIVVFCVPYLRRNSYIKWLAWLALGDAIWWAFMIVAG